MNKANDKATLWNYEKKQREVHSLAVVSQLYEQAYSLKDIGELLNRSPRTLRDRLDEFPKPYRIYSMIHQKEYGRRWDADQVMEIREVLAHTHFGRPRLDGEAFPLPVPTRTELRAMLNQEAVVYVKNKDGEFIPTWKAHQF